MKHHLTAAVLLTLVILVALPSFGQFKDQGMGAGLQFGSVLGATNYSADKARGMVRGFIRYPMVGRLFGELGVGVGRMGGQDITYNTDLLPIDYRFLLAPFAMESWSPYAYAGIGALHYILKEPSYPLSPDAKKEAWTAVVPAGLGFAFKVGDNVALDLSAGYNYTFTKDLNGYKPDKNDAYWTGLLGVVWVGESGKADPDKDGLTNDEEKQLGTDKKNPDTDGDGLKDGDEVKKYNTSPLKADSDGDGLKDGDEVMMYKTDPNKADTDGDGLSDGDEVNKYKTDPLKADTDGDGLKDGDEVNKYKTDPLKADTDGDGLSDGDEVNKYKTDPLKADTDGGTVNDAIEVGRGTNPLDPSDDVPKKEELKVEVGKSITLEGVTFKSGSAVILPASEAILEKAYNSFAQNPELTVEIQGYTDNTGKRAANVKLSQARADAVKAWLVGKGIAADRITTKGFGPDKPIAPNKKAADREKNRRIEFMRTK